MRIFIAFRGSVDAPVVGSAGSGAGPLDFGLAPSAVPIRGAVGDQIFQRALCDLTGVEVIHTHFLRLIRQHGLPNWLGSEALDAEGSRELVRVENVHIRHGPPETLLLLLRLTHELEERHVVVEKPNVIEVGRVEYRDT